MSKQVTESMLSKINRLLDITESYQAPEKMMQIISDPKTAEKSYKEFLSEFDYDLSYEWFHKYFQEEHADRKNKKQDFTPRSLSKLMGEMLGAEKQSGVIYEPAAGTGSTIVSHWHAETRKCRYPWDYFPDNYLYYCEELSSKTIPFLLFNILIRGMNAVVIHGNTLSREVEEVYACQNNYNSYCVFSELIKLPHSKEVEEIFNIKFSN